MYQLGGDYWEKFYPSVVTILLKNQDPDGRWRALGLQDGRYGDVLTTALAVIALNIPNQLLPIFQR